MNKHLDKLLLVAVFLAAACKPGDKHSANSDTAIESNSHMNMQGMSGAASDSMMNDMRNHMKTMATMSGDSMTQMLPQHRQMMANMLAHFNKEMRDMSMSDDVAWNALADSLRSDLNRMPGMNAAELKAEYPQHHARAMRLMDMHKTMMQNMHGDAGSSQAPVKVTQKEVITVYKTPQCSCCTKWINHLQANGFSVKPVDMDDLTDLKKIYGIADSISSCHTATVAGYVVEGHVPASDIIKMLNERPKAIGITVPGMPIGSPGMEGPRPERYNVRLIKEKGVTEVYSSH